MNHTTLEPNVEPTGTEHASDGRWMLLIFNNEINNFDEVIEILMCATGCDAEEASIEAWEAHHYGKAPVHFASKTECEDAASVISSIGVQTEVAPEWED